MLIVTVARFAKSPEETVVTDPPVVIVTQDGTDDVSERYFVVPVVFGANTDNEPDPVPYSREPAAAEETPVPPTLTGHGIREPVAVPENTPLLIGVVAPKAATAAIIPRTERIFFIGY